MMTFFNQLFLIITRILHAFLFHLFMLRRAFLHVFFFEVPYSLPKKVLCFGWKKNVTKTSQNSPINRGQRPGLVINIWPLVDQSEATKMSDIKCLEHHTLKVPYEVLNKR